MESPDNIGQILSLFKFSKIVALLFGVGVIVFLGHLLKRGAGKLEDLLPSHRLLSLQVTTVLSFALYIFGTALLVFGVLNPPKEMIIGLGGSAAVAIGLALKDLVASIVAGVTLLFDRPFQVGDRVAFGDVYGEITNIGLRAVRLQTLDDNEITIPNSKFMMEYVSSGNSGALDMMIVCDFYLSIHGDYLLAKKLIYEVVVTSRFVFLSKPVKIVMEEVFINNQLVLKLTAKSYVFDVRYEKDFQTDIYERGLRMFRKNKIQRPRFAVDQIVHQTVSTEQKAISP